MKREVNFTNENIFSDVGKSIKNFANRVLKKNKNNDEDTKETDDLLKDNDEDLEENESRNIFLYLNENFTLKQVKELLKQCDINSKDPYNDNDTLLTLTLKKFLDPVDDDKKYSKEYKEIINFLVKNNNFNINAVNKNNESPLTLALKLYSDSNQKDCFEIIKDIISNKRTYLDHDENVTNYEDQSDYFYQDDYTDEFKERIMHKSWIRKYDKISRPIIWSTYFLLDDIILLLLKNNKNRHPQIELNEDIGETYKEQQFFKKYPLDVIEREISYYRGKKQKNLKSIRELLISYGANHYEDEH